MTATAMLHVRMDEALKSEATAALDAMGLTASDAVRMLFKRIVAEQAFPLELKVPNAETIAALEEAREIMQEMKRTGQSRFATPEDMFASLEKAGGE
jgi:DNA-damage-inducible protein J